MVRGCISLLHNYTERVDFNHNTIMEIQPVSSIPKVSARSFTVEQVHKLSDGNYKIQSTTYYVTTYDSKGRLSTTTNNSTMSYII